jgi:hypothetical protein
MKKYINRTIALMITFVLSTSVISNGSSTTIKIHVMPNMSLLYGNVWGTIYNAVVGQCDSTPTITGDGSHINPEKASQHRWIAVSQDLLNSPSRAELVNDPYNLRFKGKLVYGDTVWIDSPYKEINGWWVVRDAKSEKYIRSIDFLQTEGDGRLYNNDKLWSGKFDDIRIYQVNHINYTALHDNLESLSII